MAKRRKSKKSSLKGFITLLILVVGILYAVGEYYFPNKVHQAQIWVQEQISGATTTHSATDSGVIINDGELVPSNYYPNVNKKITVLKNIGYISGFSNELRVPLWVGYVAIYPFKYNTVERPSSFIQDARVSGSATHHDYSNSGYDRGHMAPNYVIGRCYGEKAQMETFLMTNIIPQKPKLNRKQWKDLEQHIANILAKKYGKVLVFIGPVFETHKSTRLKER